MQTPPSAIATSGSSSATRSPRAAAEGKETLRHSRSRSRCRGCHPAVYPARSRSRGPRPSPRRQHHRSVSCRPNVRRPKQAGALDCFAPSCQCDLMAADMVALLADLAAESDVLDALVGELAEAQWRTETPAPGWTIADQIAHLGWTDELAILAATDADAFAVAVAGLLDGSVSIDDAAANGRASPARRPAGVLARRPGSPRRRSRRRSGRDQAPVVRAADGRCVDGDGPVDGDLGPRSGRRRRPRGEPPAHRPPPPRRPHRRAGPRLRLPRQRTHATRRGVPCRPRRARREPTGHGDPSRRSNG